MQRKSCSNSAGWLSLNGSTDDRDVDEEADDDADEEQFIKVPGQSFDPFVWLSNCAVGFMRSRDGRTFLTPAMDCLKDAVDVAVEWECFSKRSMFVKGYEKRKEEGLILVVKIHQKRTCSLVTLREIFSVPESTNHLTIWVSFYRMQVSNASNILVNNFRTNEWSRIVSIWLGISR